MTTDWNEPDEMEEDEPEEDPGFVGGGGPARTIFGDDEEASEELDEHGDNLSRADEDEI